MKILITGATGLVGKDIGKKLASKGYEVTVLSRDPERAARQLPFPATILQWKDYSEPVPPEYFNGINTVIHLAGESIAEGRWTKKRKQKILDSRVLGTRHLVEGILKSNGSVKRFISASAIGIYGNGQDWVDENARPANDFLATVCRAWEAEAQKLTPFGISVANPRIGIVLSRKGGALTKMLLPFSLGAGGVVGDGSQCMSWIHQDDLTNLFSFLVENPQVTGPVNAVAPMPVSNKTFSHLLASSLGTRLFFPVPRFLLRLALGEMSVLVTKGQRVSASKILSQGFHFIYETPEAALEDLCAPLKNGQQELLEEIWLPKKIPEVFPFFTDEKNLERLTPENLNFHVLKKSTQEIREGTLIDYRLKLRGIPMRWKTKIEDWQPNRRFVDIQLSGPYKYWHHTHEFEDFAGGTLMRDRVRYLLPLGRLGQVVAGLHVNADVKRIFTFRTLVISRLFGHAQQ